MYISKATSKTDLERNFCINFIAVFGENNSIILKTFCEQSIFVRENV